MIISYHHKFIFIKTRKTAGTSIDVALAKYCSENDIVTQTLPEIEGHQPRNWQNLGIIGEHDPASKILHKVNWREFFTFAFERNPWDKCVSMYWWRVNNKNSPVKEMSFKEFILKSQGRNSYAYFALPSDFDRYTDNHGNVIVDFLGRYENLTNDLNYICKKINLPWNGKLSNEKANTRKDKRHYREYYDNETREIIQHDFVKEIELFGYEF